MVKRGCGQSGDGIVKLAVSQESIDGVKAKSQKFPKDKSYLNDFRMGVIRSGHDHLVHETLKSAVS